VSIRIQASKNPDEISGRPNFYPNFLMNFLVVELILPKSSTNREVVQSVQDDSGSSVRIVGLDPHADDRAKTALFVLE